MLFKVSVKKFHLTELMSQLFSVLAITGRLLIVKTWVLGLDGRQTQLDGFIKQFTK